MQILNISVLNAPARYLTTQTYPLYFVESIETGLSIDDSASRPDPQLVPVRIPSIESIGTQMTIHDVIVTHPPKIPLTENLSAQLTMHDVVSRQLLKYGMQENLSAQLTVHDVISKLRIKTNVDEAISVSLSINDVIREKI